MVLFDHNVNLRFRQHLPGHDLRTTRQMLWEDLKNGMLLRAAAPLFDAFLSIDKKIEYEQNLKTLPMPVIILDCRENSLPYLVPFAPAVLSLLATPLDRILYVIEQDGTVLRLTSPRL